LPDADARSPLAAQDADVALLERAARAAGDIALGFFDTDVKRWTKGDESPVTEADLAVDGYLREHLSGERPGYGWLSEETADTSDRRERRTVFVVDPIDGTRAFIRGADEWTISLAIVTDGRPTASCVFCPRHDEMFVAGKGQGAFVNDRRMRAGRQAVLSGARLAGPRKVMGHEAAKAAGVDVVPFVPSLAYRLALVADGRLDGAASTRGPCDWDLAGADLLVHEAGGRLSQLSGEPLLYNRERPVHPPIAASGEPLHEALLALLAATLAGRPRTQA